MSGAAQASPRSDHIGGSQRVDALPGLTFEHVVKNKTLPPCDLNSFMDYVLYVEHEAENLQFFLWYCDYVDRWSKLLPRQKLLSPVWNPDKAQGSTSGLRASIHKRSESEKLTKILTIMERDNPSPDPDDRAPDRRSSSASEPRPRSPGPESPCGVEARYDWQPYTIQPFRDEVTKAVRHYIAQSSPRQLDLFPQERNACLNATQHTTHPSALLPAFLAAETVLRTRSYPSFARWCVQNSNRPRLLFVRAVAALAVLLGLGLDAVLVLSGANHLARIACLALWWPGFTLLFSALQGVCLVLHCKAVRALRPWEQYVDDVNDDDYDPEEASAAAVTATAATSPAETDHYDGASIVSFDTKVDALEKGQSPSLPPRQQQHHHHRATFSRVDPLRKASLQAFGPRNEFAREPWVARYSKKPMYRKVFEATTPTPNQDLRALQDRVVFRAVLWGGLVSTTLAVVSVFIPKFDLL